MISNAGAAPALPEVPPRAAVPGDPVKVLRACHDSIGLHVAGRTASQRSGPPCCWAAIAASLAAYPVRRPAPEIHHRENPDATRLDLVQQRVRKSAEKPTTNRSTKYRSGLGRSLDGLEAPINLLKESGTEAGFLKVVVPRRLVQLILCEPVKLGSVHSPQLGPSIPKYVGR